MKSFENNVAVITGAASGIGEAIAKECANRKMKVVLADINADKLVKLERELKHLTRDVISVVTDVSNKFDVANLANITASAFGNVHLLFNNAGIGGPLGAIWEVEEEDIQKVINVNLMSVIYGLREFVPIMISQNEEGYIVNTASFSGLISEANQSVYTITKHAVVALSEVLYQDIEQRKLNIHVSVLCPAFVNTSIMESTEFKIGSSQEIIKLAEFFKKYIKLGMPPQAVAEQVFAAIEKNQFYILTHYDVCKDNIKCRMEDILQIRNPTKPPRKRSSNP